jgi:peptide/nickel transport system substrate-binding protein
MGDIVRPQWSGSAFTRRSFLQRAGVGTAVFAAGGLLEACGASSASPASKGRSTSQTLRIGIGSQPQTLDVDKAIAGTDAYFSDNLYETLVGHDVNGNLVPKVAQSYSVSPDGKTFTFTLRPGVKFHDGTPVTPADVKFSFERYVAPATGNGFSFNLADMVGVDVVGADTVVIRLSAYDAGFIPAGGYASILPMKYLQTHGDAYFGKHPVATGPWKFRSFALNSNFVLDRFDGYWGEKPGYATAIFQIIPEDSTRVAALQTGQVDLIAQVPPQYIKMLSSTSGLVVSQKLDGDSVNIKFNTLPSQAGKPWANVLVRQAMDYAIDRDAIIQNVLLDGGQADTAIQPTDAAWPVAQAAGLKPRPYDPAKAKALLSQAGFGKGFSFPFASLANGRLPASEEIVEAVAGYWKNVGINAQVETLAYDTWLDAIKSTSTYPAMFNLWGDSTGGPSSRLKFDYTSKQLYSLVADPALDKLVQQAVTTVDPTQLQQNYTAVARYVQAKAYTADLFAVKGAFAMKNSVDWVPWSGVAATVMQNARAA